MLGTPHPMSKRTGLEYKPHDKYVVFNDGDKDLIPVVLRLPDPPALEYIDGYGMLPADQKFRRMVIPPRLKALERRCLEVLINDYTGNNREKPNGYRWQKEFWRVLEQEFDSYQEEIKFIKKVHWHLRYGYWFYNDGKPTYITPWHFRYLNFWIFPTGERPEYRDVDRRIELWGLHNYTDTGTFEVDENWNAIVDKDGNFIPKDIGIRTSYGVQNPKRRRRGDTNRALNKLIDISFYRRGANSTIVSDTGDHSKKMFTEKLIPAIREYPVWLMPLWEGSFDTLRIMLRPPGNVYYDDFLDSVIGFTDSSSERANDSRQLYGLLEDEKGKGAVRSDITNRWEVNKLTLSQGPIIHGYSEHPSTVEDIENGAEYESEWWSSNYYVRNPVNGQTKSGVRRLWIHSWDGHDGFVDAWGQSVIEKPNKRQMQFAPPHAVYNRLGIGAKEYLERDILPLLASGRPEDQKLYYLKIKKNPLKSADMWAGRSGDLGFDYPLLDKCIAILKRRQQVDPMVEACDLDWENGVPFSRVVIIRRDSGRFMMSDIERFESQYNLWTYGASIWNEKKQQFENQRMPLNLLTFTAGADSFAYGGIGETGKRIYRSKLSDGGGAVYWNYDPSIESSQDIRDADSGRFVCTYLNRTPSLDEYCSDMLKMCHLYGAMLAFERNKDDLWQYFVDNGYGGYLKYQQNPDGTFNKKPGFYAGEKNKERLFLEVRDYVSRRAEKEKHIEFLQDVRIIKGLDDMTNHDRFAACGWALLGAKSAFGTTETAIQNHEFNWDKFYSNPSYAYS
jgi:hypothetical protein